MIKILDRYIGKTIIQATGIVAVIMTSVLFILSLLTEAKSVGLGEYHFGQSILYVFLRMPNELYHFSPLLILLGCIIGLSILSSHLELIVMRSSGFSIRKIIYSVLSAALLLILSISILGEWVGPSLSYKAIMRKENAKYGAQAVVTAKGNWYHIDNNFIHVQSVIGRQLLNDVTRYQFDKNNKLQAVYYAKTLSSQHNKWQMKEGVKTTFYVDRTKSQTFTEMPWDLQFNTQLLNAGLVDPNELSLTKLVKFTHFLEQNGLQANEYKFNFWQRLFQPLASLVMIFLAIPFVLGAFSRSTMGSRIMIGVITGFAFFILNALLGQLCIVYQLPALFAAFLPPFIFAVFGVILSKRLIRH